MPRGSQGDSGKLLVFLLDHVLLLAKQKNKAEQYKVYRRVRFVLHPGSLCFYPLLAHFSPSCSSFSLSFLLMNLKCAPSSLLVHNAKTLARMVGILLTALSRTRP
jgi:hypothetical protein